MTDRSDYEPDDEDLYGPREPRGRRDRDGRDSRRRDGDPKSWSELQSAVDRFEKAVQDLVGSATTEFSDRATTFLNETTSRIEREFSGAARASQGSYSGSDAAARMRARRKARARARSARVLERSPRLCRDEENAKIVGVCAGIANYYGVEAWVVRCIAVTGLLFFGSIVFPAYWIMYFVMDDPKKAEKRARREARRTGREETMTSTRSSVSEDNPRSNLKHVQSDLQEVELRLRRMETHVTSGRYELQRELHKIETEGPPATAGR